MYRVRADCNFVIARRCRFPEKGLERNEERSQGEGMGGQTAPCCRKSSDLVWYSHRRPDIEGKSNVGKGVCEALSLNHMGFILSNYAPCASDRSSGHFWMCDIFSPFWPIFMSRLACKHVKSKKHEKGNIVDSLSNVMRSFMSAAPMALSNPRCRLLQQRCQGQQHVHSFTVTAHTHTPIRSQRCRFMKSEVH